MPARNKIAMSDIFLVLGTDNYVRSLRDPTDTEHHWITEQVITARHFCKPIILLIDADMDQKNKDYLKEYFTGFKKVEELPFTKTDDDAMKETLIRLIASLEEGEDKNV